MCNAEVMDDICEVISTGATVSSLEAITARLLNERLIACGQHIEAIRSMYRWNGDVAKEPEARVAWHTRLSLVPELINVVTGMHEYEVPCIFATPIVAVNRGYQEWVISETRSPEGS